MTCRGCALKWTLQALKWTLAQAPPRFLLPLGISFLVCQIRTKSTGPPGVRKKRDPARGGLSMGL